MLKSLNDLSGYRIHAADGELGKAEDFYFQDTDWIVRYLVINTGSWLTGRSVLISPASILKIGMGDDREIYLDLTKETIEKSPAIPEDSPVSRANEIELIKYYHWPVYPMGSPPFFFTHSPEITEYDTEARKPDKDFDEKTNPHLRSFKEVNGYYIQATDREIGHIEDMILEDQDWSLTYMVVDTRNWLPGKSVLVATETVNEVKWLEKKVMVGLESSRIEKNPEYDPDKVLSS